jgi:hypothetical protein
MPKGITPEQFAYRINTLKGQTSTTSIYEKDQVVELLKKFDLPTNNSYFKKYVDYGMIVRTKPGEFKFPPAPVHISKIIDALNELREESRKYATKFRAKKRDSEAEENEIQPIEEPNDEDKIARCIDFLKSKGFLILRQV